MPIQATALARSFATLTADADADIVEAETVIIGGITYTFDAILDAVNDVPFVTAFAPNMAALVNVINATGVSGTDYFAGQVRNPLVHAVLTSSGVVTIYSRVAGVVGDLIPITVGTSAIVLTDDNSGVLDAGAGFIDAAIDNLQASSQLNSEVLAFLHAMEINPNL